MQNNRGGLDAAAADRVECGQAVTRMLDLLDQLNKALQNAHTLGVMVTWTSRPRPGDTAGPATLEANIRVVSKPLQSAEEHRVERDAYQNGG